MPAGYLGVNVDEETVLGAHQLVGHVPGVLKHETVGMICQFELTIIIQLLVYYSSI